MHLNFCISHLSSHLISSYLSDLALCRYFATPSVASIRGSRRWRSANHSTRGNTIPQHSMCNEQPLLEPRRTSPTSLCSWSSRLPTGRLRQLPQAAHPQAKTNGAAHCFRLHPSYVSLLASRVCPILLLFGNTLLDRRTGIQNIPRSPATTLSSPTSRAGRPVQSWLGLL